MKKSIVSILSVFSGVLFGFVGAAIIENKGSKERSDKVYKFKTYYSMLDQWLALKMDGKNLNTYFTNHGYRNIAIYGMGEMGMRLYEELKDTSVHIAHGIDREASNTYADIDIVNIDDKLENVDVVVVTAVFAFDEVHKQISELVSCPIISLDKVISEL